nr:ATP-dependent DNA helicase RecG [Clostridia bacterium]
MTTPITSLPGIGPKRAERFAALGLYTAGDLLYHFPRAYQHRGNIQTLAAVGYSNVMPSDKDYDAETGEHSSAAFMLTVATEPRTAMLKNRMTMTKFVAFDETARVTISFFNNKYVSDIFKTGLTFRFWGRLKVLGGQFFLTAPEFELASEERHLNEFTAVYPLTEGITQKIMASSIQSALEKVLKHGTTDIIPAEIRKKHDLCSLNYALQAIHLPLSYEMLERGRRRFIYEELFMFALKLGMAKKQRRSGTAEVLKCDIAPFEQALPYPLTGAQKRTIGEIANDMANPDGVPMARIVAGDVGSGKTVCAAAAAYIAVANKVQAALMVPTAILATQHYNDLRELMEPMGVRVGLLIGSLKASDKKKIHAAIESGELDLVIGTHALISDSVHFKNLGLVITDEQHRFGVAQRAKLSGISAADNDTDSNTETAKVPHVMVMSATPIPRTLAMTMYGDLDMSILDELPPGRQKVDTFVVNESYRARLNGFIQKNVSEGRQVYVVCPQVESRPIPEVPMPSGNAVPYENADKWNNLMPIPPENANRYNTPTPANPWHSLMPIPIENDEADPDSEVKNVTDWVEQLRSALPGLEIGLLHGKMKSDEKEAVMARFASGGLNVLVSTTVIEVGVNVPNATLMIVENAERFGLSQLHQLRGRVGRGKHKSWCILVSNADTEVARNRLNAMKTTSDGFKIAEFDLQQRGPGDFFARTEDSIRQHGGLRFRLASLCTDTELLKTAFADAAELIESGKAAEIAGMDEMMGEWFGGQTV